jgi:DNA-binding transcriptional LysR family regulator
MNFNQLHAFYHVAKAGGFGSAAAALHLTQPALSWQVKNLEACLDVQLLDRVGRRVALTEEGRSLYAYAERIFTLARDAEEALADFRGLARGRMKIDATFTFGDYYLPALLLAFHRQHPQIVLEVRTGNTSQVLANTLRRENDLAFVARDPAHPDIAAREVVRDVLVAVVPPSHRLAHHKSIPLHELQDEGLIVRERGSLPRHILDELLARRAVSPRIVMESASTRAIKRMVEGGMGVAVLSQQVLREELQTGSLVKVRLRDASIAYRFYLIHRRDKYLSRALRAFIATAVGRPRGAKG